MTYLNGLINQGLAIRSLNDLRSEHDWLAGIGWALNGQNLNLLHITAIISAHDLKNSKNFNEEDIKNKYT